ncbi:uncharacterized protein I303_106028 [Kwoniella dejecticola CBS 10117]|uniref:CCHC-type domain-containing protein n=1 Tax=Kwoniella dejecticola CBS 10117 TaxID=1296121 RepID=A0A1A6A122_9TREE|nr:uncharacterized protein I303_06048 [Kwoniella dejecticola CBS 10117]OBR83766.1 hypothetical protein I303_06048 [Kwoniella dejecticola CBS 10117]
MSQYYYQTTPSRGGMNEGPRMSPSSRHPSEGATPESPEAMRHGPKSPSGSHHDRYLRADVDNDLDLSEDELADQMQLLELQRKQLELKQRQRDMRKASRRDMSARSPQPAPPSAPEITQHPGSDATRHADMKLYTPPHQQQGQRLSNVFSPGYGFRVPAPGCDNLPAPEERVTPLGSIHRIYPAPAPASRPINADEGWADEETGTQDEVQWSASPRDSKSATYSTRLAEQQSLSPPASSDTLNAVPVLHAPYIKTQSASNGGMQGSPSVDTAPTGPMVPWNGGVVYKDEELNKEGIPLSTDKLLEVFDRYNGRLGDREPPIRSNVGGGRGDRSGFSNARPQDAGWNRAISTEGRHGWSDRGGRHTADSTDASADDDGWGATAAQDQPDNKGGDGWGNERRGGGASGDGCYKCGEAGHFSRECPNGGCGGGSCFNCGKSGHISRDCTEPRRSGGGGGSCYNCGEDGHMSRECTNPRKFGAFRGTCNTCGEQGHRSSECASSGNQSGYDQSNDHDNGVGDGWGSAEKSYPSDDSAQKNTSAPSNGQIHPSRQAVVNFTSNQRQRPEAQSLDRPAHGGRMRDEGYGSGRGTSKASPPPSSRDPTPRPEEETETGGW